jgi:hypothetical protein
MPNCGQVSQKVSFCLPPQQLRPPCFRRPVFSFWAANLNPAPFKTLFKTVMFGRISQLHHVPKLKMHAKKPPRLFVWVAFP